MSEFPLPQRYDGVAFRRCGQSGVRLPPISLGLWQNFGAADDADMARAIVRHAFDHGVTHFDLANNYGPPPGAAEETFGRLLATDLRPFRDELIVTTKAGYPMGPGPYGDGGSRKYLLASLDASLRRLGLDYVDIFYHHRPDPATPLHETMGALHHAVRSGRALYAGLSNYSAERAREAAAILQALGTPCLIDQPRYSLLDRSLEQTGLLDALEAIGAGCAVFSPLAQGLLSGKYRGTVPQDARMARGGTLPADRLTPVVARQLVGLAAVARERGQSLAQLALAWALRDPRVTTAIVGARTVQQLEELLQFAAAGSLGSDELARIDHIMAPDSH